MPFPTLYKQTAAPKLKAHPPPTQQKNSAALKLKTHNKKLRRSQIKTHQQKNPPPSSNQGGGYSLSVNGGY